MAQERPQVLLRAESISKTFGPVYALDRVDLELRAGSVHAIVGHNGAGKSTLMNILSGVHEPDSGRLVLLGEVVRLRNPAEALARGIAMVHQELSVLPDLDVAENLFVGREPMATAGLVSRGELYERAERLLADLDLDIPATTLAADMPVGTRQLVEIARAVAQEGGTGGRVLILDEPTSALSATEQEKLFDFIRELSARGIGVLYVSHRLSEILAVADDITVLRDGRLVTTRPAREFDQATLVELMFGHPVTMDTAATAAEIQAEVAPGGLDVDGLGALGGRLHDITFSAAPGEILGLAGMLGSGRSELFGALFGLLPVETGTVRVSGEVVSPRGPRDAMNAGICLVPEDRRRQGIFPGLSLWKNVALASIHDLFRGPVSTVRARRAREATKAEIKRLGIVTPSANEDIQFLSGGNQQKVVLARWLTRRPHVLLLDDPTAGIDVGAKSDIHQIIRELAAGGASVVVSSSEFSELLAVATRIVVLRAGTIVAEVNPAGTTEAALVNLAIGMATA